MIDENSYVLRAAQLSGDYAKRSMGRILDSCPEGTNKKSAEMLIEYLYFNHIAELFNPYRAVFKQYLEPQLQAKPTTRKPIISCFSGPFGAGKSTLEGFLNSKSDALQLQSIEAVQKYIASSPFKFEFSWAWKATGLYNPEDHQGTFWIARAFGAGAKDAAMELAVEAGLDLLYPASLTPHVNDGKATLENEVQRLQSYKDKGYEFVLIGCAASSETCLDRVSQRDRKPSNAEVIKSVEGFNQHYRIFSDIADYAILLDTGLINSDYAVLDPEVLQ